VNRPDSCLVSALFNTCAMDSAFLLLALLPLVSSSVYELSGDNFDRLVFRPTNRASFIKFYAPWCQHCQKLAPDWKAVEKKHELKSNILVGSVDCSDGPEGRNPLCDKYRAMSLPTLMFFHPPSRLGSTYEGNKTKADLLAFAAELNSACALSALDECTDEQKAMLAEYDAVPVEKLKEQASKLRSDGEMAKMKMMMMQMQMQQMYQDKALSKEAKDSKMKDFEPQAEAASKEIDVAWEKSATLRAMQIVLREKAPVNPDEEIDEFDFMNQMGGRGGGRGGGKKKGRGNESPKKEKKKKEAEAKPKKPKPDKPCVDRGPWPCTEAGCPAPSIGCSDLKSDCKKKFSSIWAEAPEGLGDKKIWTQCRKTCDKCSSGAKEEL